MNLLLLRDYSPSATYGQLFIGKNDLDEPFCVTVEKPWLDNECNISCIPEGRYTIKVRTSPKFGEVYYLENIDLDVSLNGDTKRTYILIHPANFVQQLQGCIALGDQFMLGADGNKKGVTSSIATCSLFMCLLGGETSILTIANREAYK